LSQRWSSAPGPLPAVTKFIRISLEAELYSNIPNAKGTLFKTYLLILWLRAASCQEVQGAYGVRSCMHGRKSDLMPTQPAINVLDFCVLNDLKHSLIHCVAHGQVIWISIRVVVG
jgi:hypothetical protein